MDISWQDWARLARQPLYPAAEFAHWLLEQWLAADISWQDWAQLARQPLYPTAEFAH